MSFRFHPYSRLGRDAVRPPPREVTRWRAARWEVLFVAWLAAACGGGSAPPEPPTSAGPALAASRPGELVDHVRALLAKRDAQRASNPGGAPIDAVAAAPGPALAVGTGGAPVAHSNTNVQEAGVDEEDLIKTDGTSVYALDTTETTPAGGLQNRLLVHRRQASGDIVPAQVLSLPSDGTAYPSPRGLLLAAAARRAVVLTEALQPIGTPVPCPPEAVCIAPAALIYPPFQLKSSVELQFVELDANGDAKLGDRVSLDGRLVASRLVGSALVLVTTHTPRLVYELLPPSATPAEKADALARVTAGDVLPLWRGGPAAPQPLVAETDCYLQPKNASLTLEVTTITVVELATLSRQGRCFVGGTEGAYLSTKSLVLATSRWPYRILDSGRIVYQPQFVTDLHKFAFDGQRVDYRASGEVKGHLGWDPQRKPYRISEHANGDLRVLSFTGDVGWVLPADAESSTAPSPATLTVLRESSTERTLQTIATLPNAKRPAPLGKPGEQVHGVRFAGDRGYLVTFRRVDPLYVLDLADPADPRVAGELTVPGFSDYLFPLDGGLLFGVGKDADATGRVTGVKLGLFDVRDASTPSEITSRTLGSSGSQSGLDYSSHGINWLRAGDVSRIALPVLLTSAPFAPNPTHGLQRIEVDSAARTLTLKALLPAPNAPLADLWGDRSLQLGSKIVYLSHGQIVVADW